MKLRFISLILALLLLCTPLCACNSPAEEPNDTTPPAVTPEPEVESTPATELCPITPDNAGNIVIVLAENAPSSIKNSVNRLAQNIATKFSVTAPATAGGAEATRNGVTEIVIGANLSVFDPLREKDSAIFASGEDIYISAGSDITLYDAIMTFEDIVKEGGLLPTDAPTYFYGDYPINSLKINGVHIAKYKLVIPTKANLYEKFAAEIFAAYISENVGFSIATVTDSEPDADHEILIGSTSRSPKAPAFAYGEYALYTSGSDIVCLGKDHMVAAGLSLITEEAPANKEAHSLIINEDTATRKFEYKEADSAILMIGDGMGFGSIEMTEKYKKLDYFLARDLPVHGESKTNNVSNSTTDSAAGATALSTGYKTVNGYLGVDKNKAPIVNVRELADIMGAKTAVLTTDSITGATPAGFLVHHSSRNDTDIIRTQINSLTANKTIEFCEGSVGDNLLARFKVALNTVTEDSDTFFVMLEEAYIDKSSHSNDYLGTISAVVRFNDSIAYAMVFTVFNPDTVLIITADHETGGIKQNSSGNYKYTSTSHTSANVPIFACGANTEIFNGKAVENTEIAKFIATTVFGAKSFGN